MINRIPRSVPPPSTFTTIAVSVEFKVTAPNNTTLHIDWGNGDSENVAMTGSQITINKNYGSGGTRVILFSGNANTALTSLNCSSNSLTALDISTNTALTSLRCYSNSLTALDVSTNTELTSLYCYSNSLTSAVINSHMADLVSAGLNGGTYSGAQTPSAPPTGQGITDKATLIASPRLWSVTTD